jgi:hypothetical protein
MRFSREMDDFYVPFGRMTNFQTRKGQFDLLSDVFEYAKERANEGLNRFLSKLKCIFIIKNFVCFSLVRKEGIDHTKVSEVIGKAYLILTDFSRPRRTDYSFSWHDIASKDGIAFLLLYCHARLCRYNPLLFYSNISKIYCHSLEKQVNMPIDWSANVDLLTDRREQILIQQLST